MEREEMPVDVLFVGAGPACLLGSIHLMNLIEAHNEAVQSGEKQGEVLDEPMIAVLEKGSEVGAHQLSGAVIDPKALAEEYCARMVSRIATETWAESKGR